MSRSGDGGGGDRGEGLASVRLNGLRRYVPVISWLPGYDRSWLTVDTIAGLTLWGLVVPEGMAYAGIAGLPPQAGLYTLVASLLIYALLGTSRHLSVVGTLPKGLPSLSLPDVPLSAVLGMVVTAIGVVLVAFSEALGTAQEFAEKHGYEVDPDQELIAHGVTYLVSGLFGGMIAGGSMSASAVKEGAGARTQVANLVAWIVTIVTLLFLTPLFAPLPEAVLAALIIHALWHLVTSRKLLTLRRAAPVEVWFGVLTLWGVLLFDVLQRMRPSSSKAARLACSMPSARITCFRRCTPPCRRAGGGVGSLHRAGDDRAERRSHLADGCRQGVRPREAAHGRSLAHAALPPGHPADLRGASRRLRRPRGPDPGSDRVQRDQGSRGGAPGAGHGPAAATAGDAASALYAGRDDAAGVVGRSTHPPRRRPGAPLTGCGCSRGRMP